MTKYITIDKKVIEQALEALERGPWTLIQKEQYNNAITALRTALEKSTESEPGKSRTTFDTFPDDYEVN